MITLAMFTKQSDRRVRQQRLSNRGERFKRLQYHLFIARLSLGLPPADPFPCVCYVSCEKDPVRDGGWGSEHFSTADKTNGGWEGTAIVCGIPFSLFWNGCLCGNNCTRDCFQQINYGIARGFALHSTLALRLRMFRWYYFKLCIGHSVKCTCSEV
jgi:hypothetical protein